MTEGNRGLPRMTEGNRCCPMSADGNRAPPSPTETIDVLFLLAPYTRTTEVDRCTPIQAVPISTMRTTVSTHVTLDGATTCLLS